LASLKNYSENEIAAIELALRHKANLTESGSIKDSKITERLSIGGVWMIYEIAQHLGIVDALGNDRQGQLALGTTRIKTFRGQNAQTYAIASVIDLNKGFNEEDLYKNFTWLDQNQASIEDQIFNKQFSDKRPHLFLYDVTRSYLEGEKNELGQWGYNRDKKKGKKQIVVGL